MYYYFYNDKKVVESILPINTRLNKAFVELTPEQTAFYLEHPTASVHEIKNCELDPPYVPPTPDVAQYASEKNTELKTECYATVTVTTLEYAAANAVLAGTALVYTGKRHYTTSEAIALMKRFMDESDHALDVYETYSVQITAASSIEDIDTIYQQALEALYVNDGNNK